MPTARQRPRAFLEECERYIDRKTICFKCTRERRGQADVHLLVCSATTFRSCDLRSSHDRMHFLFTMSNNRQAHGCGLQAVCRTRFVGWRASPPMRRWWSQTGSNRRPHACKARALPTELWPRAERCSRMHSHLKWWAWEDLNFRPHAYQARALTN
jgi:hypothetical protein